jgi:hypothetical protein
MKPVKKPSVLVRLTGNGSGNGSKVAESAKAKEEKRVTPVS